MSKQKIKFEMEELKITSLRFFLDKQGKNLEEEIVAAVDTLYEKVVPSQTREFIGSQFETKEQDENALVSISQGAESSEPKPKRNSKQSKQKAAAVQKDTLQPEMEAEAEAVQETDMTLQM